MHKQYIESTVSSCSLDDPVQKYIIIDKPSSVTTTLAFVNVEGCIIIPIDISILQDCSMHCICHFPVYYDFIQLYTGKRTSPTICALVPISWLASRRVYNMQMILNSWFKLHESTITCTKAVRCYFLACIPKYGHPWHLAASPWLLYIQLHGFHILVKKQIDTHALHYHIQFIQVWRPNA